MSLMPVYYNMNKTRLRKKISKRDKRYKEKHEKWLREFVGESGSKKESEKLILSAAKKTERYLSVGNGIGNGYVKKTSTLSGDYIVGQAYNKGNLVVLSKEDAKDETTGKRR